MRDDRESHDVSDIFKALRESPVEEQFDREAVWVRLQADMRAGDPADVAAPGFWRRLYPGAWSLGWQLAGAAAVVLAVSALLMPAFRALEGDDMGDDLVAGTAAPEAASPAEPPPGPAIGPEPLVIVPDDALEVAPESSDAPELPVEGYRLDLRLVAVAAGTDAAALPAAGAGGADALRDILATLRASLPDRSFALVGSWAGVLAPGAQRADLDDRTEIRFESVQEEDGDAVVIHDVRLASTGALVAERLALQPGRVTVIGVPGAGGERLLALRLQRIAAPDSQRR